MIILKFKTQYLIYIFTAFFAVLLGFILFFSLQVTSHIGSEDTQGKTFIVEEGQGLRKIAQNLAAENLIDSEFYFVLYAMVTGHASDMQAGVYELSPAMSIREIANAINGGEVKGFISVTFPEGLTSAQIEALLIKNSLAIAQGEFIALVEMGAEEARVQFDYEFLGKIFADSLEGFLFPDTYEFRDADTAIVVLDKFLRNFQLKTRSLVEESKNFYQTVIFASLLEREVQTEEDMRLVAGILENRLAAGMPLQVDATLAYISGKKTGQITNEDKFINSPFNTYKYRGLPPAPIANPGLQAMYAALNPKPTDYFYYLSAPDGTTIFSKTLNEHNANKARYLF